MVVLAFEAELYIVGDPTRVVCRCRGAQCGRGRVIGTESAVGGR